MVAVGSGSSGAGIFSLFSGVKTGCLTGDSWNLRFSRFEAACTRVLVSTCSASRLMMQVAAYLLRRCDLRCHGV